MSQTIASAAAHEQTASFALTREQFEQARAAFKRAAAERRLTASSICAWSILRGMHPSRGFAPVSNPTKLANGARPWAALERARQQAESRSPEALGPWAGLLAEAGCKSSLWSWEGDHPILSALSAHKLSR